MAQFKESDLLTEFRSTPGETIVNRLLLQLSKVPGMTRMFGPYKVVRGTARATDQQRWADYYRQDWSIRQLPAINVFEAQTEAQTSDEGWLTGTISVQVFWPPNFRRSDLSRIPNVFKGVLQNFFASSYVRDMLDEHYSVQREAKVPGLNELGKTLTWSPNVDGIVESDAVPVTILDVGYRIDLRAWHRTLEAEGRTKANPFEALNSALTGFDGLMGDGIRGTQADRPLEAEVIVDATFQVNNP